MAEKVIVNLTKTDGDGKLMQANNPLAPSPSYITYAQLRYYPFTSAESIQGAFVDGANSTVEFDVAGSHLTKLLKLYVSTNGTTYAERKSWGGTEGKTLINPTVSVEGEDIQVRTNQTIELQANTINLNAGVNLNFTAASGNISFQDEIGEKFLTTKFGTPTALESTPAQIQTVTLAINGQEYKLMIKP